jgi:dihydrofolate reductase
MRKITVLSMISLDGVMQAPGAPKEDSSGGFKYGGWVAPFQDEESSKVFQKMMEPADLLLGRKTFEIFESYWPKHERAWPGIGEVTKYAVSKTKKKSNWKNSVFLKGVADIKKIKKGNGPDIKVWGSSKLVQFLFKNDLVDELWLVTYPIILGRGKKLFDNRAVAGSFTLVEATVTPGGVILANYKRAGKVKSGTVGG